jgi:hypothetical protein
MSLTSERIVLHACNRIGDRNYTAHIIRPAFDDMEGGY